MANLYLHGKQIESVFELLGNNENDITYSIGWVLANSRAFLNVLLGKLAPKATTSEEDVIQLQEYKRGSGITDIEIRGMEYHVIIEAKRGWSLPSEAQLHRYAKRLKSDKDKHNSIVVMSECTHDYAELNLPTTVLNISIKFISWKDIDSLIDSVEGASHFETSLLKQLRFYLRRMVNMQNQLSNMVYVVSLGSGMPDKSVISWIDIVEKKHRYFHPIAKGWPSNPPNYMGFRYGGKLQRIHHVDSWRRIDDLHLVMKELAANHWQGAFYYYSLGPAIIPSKVIKNGDVYPSGRVWAMLDLLLTCPTVSDALVKTKARQDSYQ